MLHRPVIGGRGKAREPCIRYGRRAGSVTRLPPCRDVMAATTPRRPGNRETGAHRIGQRESVRSVGEYAGGELAICIGHTARWDIDAPDMMPQGILGCRDICSPDQHGGGEQEYAQVKGHGQSVHAMHHGNALKKESVESGAAFKLLIGAGSARPLRFSSIGFSACRIRKLAGVATSIPARPSADTQPLPCKSAV